MSIAALGNLHVCVDALFSVSTVCSISLALGVDANVTAVALLLFHLSTV